MFNINNLVEIFNNNSTMAFLLSLLISIGISMAAILPSLFVTGANIIFFGPVKGFLISLLGETLGAYFTFIVYRFGFKKKIHKFINKHILVAKIARREGKLAGLLIFQGRIIPFIPSGFVTIAAAMSSVSGKLFIIATLLGKVPSIALEVLVSYDIINISGNWLRLLITISTLLVAYFTVKKIERR